MKRVIRTEKLTTEQASKYRSAREKIARELPALVQRHHERAAADDELKELLDQLKAARLEKGLSLADVAEVTGMDRAAISRLESGQRPNPTVETLMRYAEAVGKEIEWKVVGKV